MIGQISGICDSLLRLAKEHRGTIVEVRRETLVLVLEHVEELGHQLALADETIVKLRNELRAAHDALAASQTEVR